MEKENSYQITISNGKSFHHIKGKNILESALLNGFILSYSCKDGKCGVCKATLLGGQIREVHPQIALEKSDKKKNLFLTCCCEPEMDIKINSTDLSALHGLEAKIFPVRILNITLLSDHIIEVKLRYPPSSDFRFLEGQYIDVIGPNGVKRSYSIYNTSYDNVISLLIRKFEGGILSDYWFKKAKINDLLRIEGPKGTFYLNKIDKYVVFLATGTGIAPVMSILNKLDLDCSIDPSCKLYLFWGNRYESDFVVKAKFKNINVETFYTLSQPCETWKGEVGYVQDIALSKLGSFQDTSVYACGSYEMIRASKQLFISHGLDEMNYFSDAFVKNHL